MPRCAQGPGLVLLWFLARPWAPCDGKGRWRGLCTPTRDTELTTLRRAAEDLAKQRGQKPTTTHLLAALASGRDDAAQLLLDRRLDADVLLKAARVTVDDASDAIARAIQRARDLAARSGAGRTDARSVHVLFSLCQETGNRCAVARSCSAVPT